MIRLSPQRLRAWLHGLWRGDFSSRLARLARWPPLRIGAPLIATAVAAWVLLPRLHAVGLRAVMSALANVPAQALFLAVVLTIGSYACLAVTEAEALRRVGRPLKLSRSAIVSTTAYAVSNTMGFSLASGGLVRLRLYRANHLSAGECARVTVLAGLAVSLSGLVAGGLGLVATALVRPPFLANLWLLAAGVALATPANLWFLAFRHRDDVPFTTTARWRALLAGLGDWIFSAGALFCLLQHAPVSAFPAFLAVYVLGSLVSAASGVPGGLGVFEAVVIALSGIVTSQVHETAAALLLYRLIYGIGPLVLMTAAAAARRLTSMRREDRP